MSYASALLNGVSEDRPLTVSPPKTQTQPRPQAQHQQKKQQQASSPQGEKRETQTTTEAPAPKVTLKLEGNDGGDLGKLFRDEKDNVYTRQGDDKKKKVGKVDRIFDSILANCEPATVSALGRTCKTFLTQILRNQTLVSKLYGQQKITKPHVTFKVDFVEPKGKGGEDEEPKEKDVKSVPLTFFSDNQRRQNALCRYWIRVVSHAQEEAEKSVDISNFMGEGKGVTPKLHGGLNFSGNKRGPLIAQRDLSRTLNWLGATVNLLQGKMQQEVPYLDGRVVLTRYGLGGTKIKVQVFVPSLPKGEDAPPTLHRYEFAEFCMEIRSAVKPFVPLVGTCIVSLKAGTRNVNPDETDQYLQREKILINLLKHQQLDQAVKRIKTLLIQGVIPNSELPTQFRKMREEKVRLKAQQAIEAENIAKFLAGALPDDFEQARIQAQRLNEEAKVQQERDREERKKAFEERKNKKVTGDNKTGEKKDEDKEDEPPKEVIKRVVTKEKDAEGFIVKKVSYLKNGQALDVKEVKAEREVAPAAKEEPTASPFYDNPYSAALQSGNFISKEADQHKKNLSKVKGRDIAEEKRRAQVNKEKKEKAQAVPQGKKAAKGQQKQGGQKQAQKQPQKQPQKQQQQQAQPKQQPAAQTKPKNPQNQPKKAAQKKPKQINKAKKQQQAYVPPTEDFFQPTAIALSVVGVLAFGYILISGAF